jgi:lipopolysaccharide export system permease protein
MHLSARDLARAIERTEGDAYRATRYRVDLQQRLAAPSACLLLPALAVLLVVRSRRASLTRSLLAAAGLGVGYLLLVDVSASLGYGGRLPPPLAAWAPPGVVAGIGAVLLGRSRG